MTRRRGDGPADEREDLLAAHVTGGLDADEAARVEALLAESPDARAEADAIGRLLAEVRAAEPRPTDEPDWGSMTRAIQRAIAEESGADEGHQAPAAAADPVERPARAGRPIPASRPARASWIDRLRPARWLAAPRAVRWPTTVVGAAAVAAAILFLTRPAPTTGPAATTRAAATARTATTAPDPAAAGVRATAPDAAGDDDPGEDVAFDPLADPEDAAADPAERTALAELDRALGEGGSDADPFIADLLAADPPDDDDADDRDAAVDAAGVTLDDDAVDPFRAADPSALDRLADQLDDQDLEALDRFLAEAHAG